MVRSHWIGPVFGVLALTGLAPGQTAPPLAPAAAGDGGAQIITVQELGKPGQKCKILKRWTEPDGSHCYQAQALDTGELMTIADAPGLTPPLTPAGRLGAAAMRIFHWGRGADGLPPGTPMPPPDAIVLSPPPENHQIPVPTPSLAAMPAPKSNGPAAAPPLTTKIDSSPYAAGGLVVGLPKKQESCQACQCAPPVVGRIEPTPSDVGPIVSGPLSAWPFAAGPVQTADDGKTCPCQTPVVTKLGPAPYPPVPSMAGWFHPTPTAAPPMTTDGHPTSSPIVIQERTIIVPSPTDGVAQGPAAKAPGFRLLDPSTWKGTPTADAHDAKTPAASAVKTPADANSKTPAALTKAPTTPAPLGDWRESWGKIDSPKAPPPTVAALAAAGPKASPAVPVARPDVPPLPPTVAASPAKPIVLPPPAPVAVVAPPTVPPAKPLTLPPAPVAVTTRPDLPPLPPLVVVPPVKPTAKAPSPALALNTPPAASLPPAPGPATATPPHAQAMANDPLADPQKYVQVPHAEDAFGKTDPAAKPKTSLLAALTGKPATPAKAEDKKADAPASAQPADAATTANVPLGMKSALAARTLADPTAPGAASGPDAAIGFDPNEPNAFSEPRAKTPGAANAFTDAPPPPPPHNPQGIDQASNAFVNTDPPPTPASIRPGMNIPHVPDAALPTRILPSPTAYPAPLSVSYSTPRPTTPVVPAGYRPGNAYDLTPLASVLRESLYPSQREDAAEQLGAMDWRRQPEVLDLLVERARQDPAPAVRAECVRSLNRLKANTLPVVEAVKTLKSDEDPRVRHEAEDAYAALTGATPTGDGADGSAAH